MTTKKVASVCAELENLKSICWDIEKSLDCKKPNQEPQNKSQEAREDFFALRRTLEALITKWKGQRVEVPKKVVKQEISLLYREIY